MMSENFNITGLTDAEVTGSRLKYGYNRLLFKKDHDFIDAVKGMAKEPMVILLLVTSSIYFISGKTGDGIFLAGAIVLVAGISLFQDSRSRNALEKLKDMSEPTCKVIRNGTVNEIKSQEIVIGDVIIVDEGLAIPADGIIIRSNDFSVNESILTGESIAVSKDATASNHDVFHGTTVVAGLAIVTVTAIGNQTRLGKIGKSLETIVEEKTPLQQQINNFVKKMVISGGIIFLIVWVINFIRSADLLDSLIKALTLAMSVLPEEIPVAFTTFMALGSWRLMKMGIVVKQMKIVETLGSASVICTDKTGTITENKMSLAKLYTFAQDCVSNATGNLDKSSIELIRLAMWASEPIPFDPMGIALHEAYVTTGQIDERANYKFIHEYPLGGQPPMMTHLFEDGAGSRIIAAKGAPEALMKVSYLSRSEIDQVTSAVTQLASEGYRVLAVGQAKFDGFDFPATQQSFKFTFKGLVAFYDPPKKNIREVLEAFYGAGIAVKIITGDNALTTRAIAAQIGFHGFDKNLSGDEMMLLNDAGLSEKVETTGIFSRMFPDAKLRIINTLKAKNKIVAMIGDGVNDGPALKAAHIGIAMGKKGTEIAKQAASMILLKDDLSPLIDAVAMGRRIYANLKKAIQYIISIHIPIILTVFIPLALGWVYPNIFSPMHVIFLELIMGPTCSIIYENEPMEDNTMLQKPRPLSSVFFSWKELTTSVIQGLAITVGILLTYQYAVMKGADEQLTRTMVFTCLIAANIMLTLVNRSFYYSLFTTIKYRNRLLPLIIFITSLILAVLLYVKPLTAFFGFELLNGYQISFSVGIGFLSVAWFELVKWRKRQKHKSK